MLKPVLILGGTTEARQLAGRLAARKDIAVTLSLAGRTANPVEQGVPTRSGGFGGADGLATYLRDNGIALLIDATHPYAASISANAKVAATQTIKPLIALRRPGWESVEGDRWIPVKDAAEAVLALGAAPRRVFLALGRQELAPFEAASQHSYVIRSVDPIEPPLRVPNAVYIRARGPFDLDAELKMLRDHRIDAVVSKNSGGDATYGKIEAARALGIDIIIFKRPQLPDGLSGSNVDEVLKMSLHELGLTDRGE